MIKAHYSCCLLFKCATPPQLHIATVLARAIIVFVSNHFQSATFFWPRISSNFIDGSFTVGAFTK